MPPRRHGKSEGYLYLLAVLFCLFVFNQVRRLLNPNLQRYKRNTWFSHVKVISDHRGSRATVKRKPPPECPSFSKVKTEKLRLHFGFLSFEFIITIIIPDIVTLRETIWCIFRKQRFIGSKNVRSNFSKSF